MVANHLKLAPWLPLQAMHNQSRGLILIMQIDCPLVPNSLTQNPVSSTPSRWGGLALTPESIIAWGGKMAVLNESKIWEIYIKSHK